MDGGIRVLAIYADRLRQRGHKVTVVSIPPARQKIRTKIFSWLRGKGWPKDPASEGSYFDNVSVRHHVLKTARPVRDRDVPDADIVLATYWKTAPWVAALSPIKGAKAILLQGYETSPGREDPAIDAAWRLPLSKIVISKWMVKFAHDRFGDANVHFVPNSVDTTQFYALPRRKQQVPSVGILYSTLHLKGVDLALVALKQLRKRVGNLKVVVLSAWPVSPQLPLPNWCEFFYRPTQEEIRHIYAKCDVWLCASRREGFHLPPLEAMACRCPVVSTEVGGPIDIIENGANGYLVPVDDAKALVDCLLKVLTLSDAEWKQMSDAALATATRYTWDDATDRLENAFCEILNRNHS